MSKYLEELYEIYLQIKKEKLDFEATSPNGDFEMFLNKLEKTKIIKFENPEYPQFEIGEIYMVDNFLLLLTGEMGDFHTGYKTTEWVEFATNEDFIFEFNNDKYLAILEKLFVPKDKLGTYIGKIPEKYIDILFDYEINDNKIPGKYTGLTVPENAVQHKFRKNELKEVAHYIFNQFVAIEEGIDEDMDKDVVCMMNQKACYNIAPDILKSDKMVQKLQEQINSINFPAAAHSNITTARGEDFILSYDKSKNILTIQLINKLRDTNILTVKFFNKKYKFYKEKDKIDIEILIDYIDVNYIAKNMKIYENLT